LKLVKFIENRYQELKLEEQTNKDSFSVRIDSEMKAAHEILSFYRWIAKWALIPKVICHWIAVNMKMKLEPIPVITNKLKEQQEAAKANAANIVSITETPKA
jgi:hypothetical protein